MPESNPILGFAGALVFAVIGSVALAAPRFLQRWAQKAMSERKSFYRPPFSDFVDSAHYIPALRIEKLSNVVDRPVT
jgi:hypothetical protein